MSLPKTNEGLKCPSHLSEKYWGQLSERDRELYRRIRPRPQSPNGADISLSGLEEFLASQERDVIKAGGKFELMPDFQRWHVWTHHQQVAFIEALLRGVASAEVIFNCPGWVGDGPEGDIPQNTMQCVDGLQRITAIRRYAKGEFAVFGDLRVSDLNGGPFRLSAYRVHFEIHEIANRADLLQFYLDLNFGGVQHTEAERLRVRGLLAQAASPAPEVLPGARPPLRPR